MANIPAELKALPLEHIIGSPLTAAIKAQALAAETTVDFIREVGLRKDDETSSSAGEELSYVARYVEFKFDRVLEERIGTSEETQLTVMPSKLTVPLLSIVPIPFIRINDMNIDFEYQIKDIVTSESKHNANVSTSARAGGWFYKVQLRGSYSYGSVNKRETDRRTTLKINVNAVQDQIPEGLARVLDILHDSTKVVPIE